MYDPCDVSEQHFTVLYSVPLQLSGCQIIPSLFILIVTVNQDGVKGSYVEVLSEKGAQLCLQQMPERRNQRERLH